MRTVLYIIIIACLAAGGLLDARAGKWNVAVTAWLFACANGVIFFWR